MPGIASFVSCGTRESHIVQLDFGVGFSRARELEPPEQGCSSTRHSASLELQGPLLKSSRVLNEFFYFKLNLNFTYLKVKNHISQLASPAEFA